MKNWWRKWSYEVPLAFGDLLWEVLVVQFAAFLDRLTVRKAIEFVVIALLVMAFVQTFPIDIAILFAGDTLMYLEIAVAIRLAAGREHFWEAAHLVARFVRFVMRSLKVVAGYSIARVSRIRERRDPAGATRPQRIIDNSDDDGSFGITWNAFASA